MLYLNYLLMLYTFFNLSNFRIIFFIIFIYFLSDDAMEQWIVTESITQKLWKNGQTARSKSMVDFR